MIDEALLDEPGALSEADPGGLLPAVAAAGAQVRTSARAALESDLRRLTPEGRPRAIVLAGPGPDVPLAAGLLRALTDDAVPVTRLTPAGALAVPGALTWPLPTWAGPVDLLLLSSADGTEPGLTLLVETAYRRGCALAAVAPEGSPLAEATARRRGLVLPFATVPHVEPPAHPAAPGPYWSHLTPLLLLGDRLGLFPDGAADGPATDALADRLDELAARCGPAVPTQRNPAKTLATELAEALPVLWSEGPLAHAAAYHAAATLTALPGLAAQAAALPEALTAHGALLRAARRSRDDDLFRDRVEEPPSLRPRVLLLRSPLGHPDGPAASAVSAARDLAAQCGAPLGEIAATEPGGPLPTAAELLAPLDYASAYLALTTAARP